MGCSIYTPKKRDRMNLFVKKPKILCEDCGDDMQPTQRRRKCSKCDKLVCGWCFNHVHRLRGEKWANVS